MTDAKAKKVFDEILKIIVDHDDQPNAACLAAIKEAAQSVSGKTIANEIRSSMRDIFGEHWAHEEAQDYLHEHIKYLLRDQQSASVPSQVQARAVDTSTRNGSYDYPETGLSNEELWRMAGYRNLFALSKLIVHRLKMKLPIETHLETLSIIVKAMTQPSEMFRTQAPETATGAVSEQDRKMLAAGFDHPCKNTCSGWRQGYERGIENCSNAKPATMSPILSYGLDGEEGIYAENPADVTLMGAAPDLLEALELCLSDDAGDLEPGTVHKAMEAIRKAKGVQL